MMTHKDIVSYLPLVASIASKYHCPGLEQARMHSIGGSIAPIDQTYIAGDFVQAGTIGLIKAAKRYNPSKDNGFAAYATPCIHHEIQVSIYRWRHGTDRPVEEEPVFVSDIIIDEEDEETSIFDSIADETIDVEEEAWRHMLRKELIATMKAYLTGMQRDIITLRYFYDLKACDVARILDTSKQSVSNLEKKALAKMRERLKDKSMYF